MTTHAETHAPVQPVVYLRTYGALLVLMALTVVVWYVPNHTGTGHINQALALSMAMLIAIIKALLVILFFMQVKYSSKLTWLWAGLGFMWLLFMSGIIMDYVSRNFRMPDGRPF
jgi:cytochrome c oxidase subunit 4